MLRPAASGCLQMSRYRGSEGDAAPGFGGFSMGVGWDEAWVARIGSVCCGDWVPGMGCI
jgi:hypothetical protein